MPKGRGLVLSETEQTGLEALVRAGSTEQRIVKRATIVLMAAGGLSNAALAKRCGCNINTVKLWRNRWIDRGMEGLSDAPGRGRKVEYIGEREAHILAATLERPEDETHWSARRLAKRVGASKSTVHRIWKRNNK